MTLVPRVYLFFFFFGNTLGYFILSLYLCNFSLFYSAKAALDSIFKKREIIAARGAAMEAHRSKRVRIGDGPPVIVAERVPTFMAEKPVGVADDTTHFEVWWGLARKDTVAESSEAPTI